MEENNVDNKKLSYEELEKVAVTLQNKVVALEKQIRALNLTALRLDFMFRVLNVKDSFGSEFVKKCALEVQELLTIKEDKESN